MTLFIHMLLNWPIQGLFGLNKKEMQHNTLHIQQTAVLADVIPAYDIYFVPTHHDHPLPANLRHIAEMPLRSS